MRRHLRSMAKVDTFAALSTLHNDTMLAGQTPGNGAAKTPFQVELSTLLAWLVANWPSDVLSGSIPGGTSGSVAIPANKVVTHIIVTSTGAGTLDIGTSGGASDVSDDEPYVNGSTLVVANKYFAASGTLYFSGHSHAITVKIILENAA